MAASSSYANDDLASEFDADSEYERSKRKRSDLAIKTREAPKRKADKQFFAEEWNKEDRKQRFLTMDVYTRHKTLVNEYLLCHTGAAAKVLKRDTRRDKTDIDVIRENSKFLWDESEQPVSWAQKLAKRYYDKLFKEYCIADLSRYKENKVAMRWRVEKEVMDGKGQFICGDKRCNERRNLTSWEVNFAYMEGGEKKNALVKLRLCPECSSKLNYHHKRHQATKSKRRRSEYSEDQTQNADDGAIVSDSSASALAIGERSEEQAKSVEEQKLVEKELWSKPAEVEEEKTREDEFTEFLEDLFM